MALPGYEIFKYLDQSGEVRDAKVRDLNACLKEVMGEEFTPKDFRTWAGTLFAAVKLARSVPPRTSSRPRKMCSRRSTRLHRGSATPGISPASHRPLLRRLRDSLLRRADRGDHCPAGGSARGGGGAPGAVDQ